MNEYTQELKKAMELLAKDPNVLFLGQTVGCPGSRYTYDTLKEIDESRRIELPVMEETQMGMSTGLALAGFTPVSVFPRLDFLVLGLNQLVNHLDKLKEMSAGQYNPKVIIRSVVGGKLPMYPGPQHSQDHTEALKLMLTNVYVKRLDTKEEVVDEYLQALQRDKPSLLIEIGQYHVKYEPGTYVNKQGRL